MGAGLKRAVAAAKSTRDWRPEVGASYHNGKGSVRRVIDVGPQFVLYQGQADRDCLLYEVTAGRNKGRVSNMTVTAFQQWVGKGGKVE